MGLGSWARLCLPLLMVGFVAERGLAQVPEVCAEIDGRSGVARLEPQDRERISRLLEAPAPARIFIASAEQGTGKTLAAAVLGEGRELHRIALSAVVGRYIGETEKNLSRIFDQAEGRDVVLLFDEADALFGRRSEVRDAPDRTALETEAIRRRIAAHPGSVVLVGSEAITGRAMERTDLVIQLVPACRTRGRPR